ncbi:MAG: glycosyltransferase [Lachnospiraceae bacterium]|nr:glycosyltransferase [Lachnospiraceae bacterium]
MNQQDLITIIVPVYKVEEYIHRCVDSLLRQTYPNLEIILVDDGSPDNCPVICDEYAAKDDRILVIHKENGGLSDARNAGLEVAKGKYIGFVDSDDYVQDDMYEKLYRAAVKCRADIVVCGLYTEQGEKLVMEEAPRDEMKILSGEEAQLLLLQDKDMKNYAWNKLYTREVFEGIRYPYRRNFEDIATTYLLFDKAKTICWIPDYLYFYQIREDSISFRNSSDEKWYRNCKDIVQAHQERCEFYEKKRNQRLKEWAVAGMLPYIYTCIRFAHKVGKEEESGYLRELLLNYEPEILQNPLIAEKDKKLLRVYAGSPKVYKKYLAYNKYGRKMAKGIRLAKKAVKKVKARFTTPYDFSLSAGKTKRLVAFELPCFDNLGDHAIAYAIQAYLEAFVQRHPEYQLFVIDGWKTPEVIPSLKKQISAEDVIFCQGGGNMGSLYPFAEEFRNKVLRAFGKNKIIVFPQTIYLSEDEQGRKTAEEMKKVYSACKDLTIFARDHRSAEIMKAMFSNPVVEMVDIVVSLDKGNLNTEARKDILLCLRSDKESALNSKQKQQLYEIAKKNAKQVRVTDTIAAKELQMEERESVLLEKWATFAKARLVITDRLHGMIFSLITKTPCIVLGNNHHKVYETYRTLAKCDYLYYCENIEAVEQFLNGMDNIPEPVCKTDFSDEFKKIDEQIL